jgi:hypothetical protein
MPEAQYLVVELSQHHRSLKAPQLRVVMESADRFTVEWRTLDALGHASWRRVELPDHESAAVAEVLAAAVVAQLGAWPSWFKTSAPEHVTPAHDKARLCEIKYHSFESRVFPRETHVRVAHVEIEHGDRPGTFAHYCLLESASRDALGVDGWRDCEFESPASKYSDPLCQLAETVASLSGIRHEKDHKSKWYSAQVIPPSRYVSCSCGASRSDGDYEVVISCRHCGNVIGPAQ